MALRDVRSSGHLVAQLLGAGAQDHPFSKRCGNLSEVNAFSPISPFPRHSQRSFPQRLRVVQRGTQECSHEFADPLRFFDPPSWFGEVVIISSYLRHGGVLTKRCERVRLARCRFGHAKVIDVLAMLLGSAISGERTLEAGSELRPPFVAAFRALSPEERLLPCFLPSSGHSFPF
jgi:hypothetical protein